MSLKDEIFEQPAVLQGLLDTQTGLTLEMGERIRQSGVHSVFLAARGSCEQTKQEQGRSYHAAIMPARRRPPKYK